jgi:hypothetical protein
LTHNFKKNKVQLETNSGEDMATTPQIEEILKAAQAMSKEERLRLIAGIAALPEQSQNEKPAETTPTGEMSEFDQEVMMVARQVMDKYDNLFRQLAEWPQDISPKKE